MSKEKAPPVILAGCSRVGHALVAVLDGRIKGKA
jgi:hypothetical protein